VRAASAVFRDKIDIREAVKTAFTGLLDNPPRIT